MEKVIRTDNWSFYFTFFQMSIQVPAGVNADATDVNGAVSVYTSWESDPKCVSAIFRHCHWKSFLQQLKVHPHIAFFLVPKCITGSLLTDCGRGQVGGGSSQQLYPWDNFAIWILTLLFCCLPFIQMNICLQKVLTPPSINNSMPAKEKRCCKPCKASTV